MDIKLTYLSYSLAVGIFLIPESVLGFWVKSDDGAYDALIGEGVHQEITREALTGIGWELLTQNKINLPQNKIIFHPAALTEIKQANSSIDSNNNTKDNDIYHCDNEMLANCSFIVAQAKKAAIEQAVAMVDTLSNSGHTSDKARAIRALIGSASHTLQDFYSHTNWINIGSDVHPTFGTAEFIDNYNVPGNTCSTVSNTLLPISQLTSGYYKKSKYPEYEHTCTSKEFFNGLCNELETYIPLSYNAPYLLTNIKWPDIQKCVHGHVCNGLEGVQKTLCEAVKGIMWGAGTEGIHKDSKHRPDFKLASDAAKAATKEYVFGDSGILHKIRNSILDDATEDKVILAVLGYVVPEVSILDPIEGASLNGIYTIMVKVHAPYNIVSQSSSVINSVKLTVNAGSQVSTSDMLLDSSGNYVFQFNSSDYNTGDATITIEACDSFQLCSSEAVNVVILGNAAFWTGEISLTSAVQISGPPPGYNDPVYPLANCRGFFAGESHEAPRTLTLNLREGDEVNNIRLDWLTDLGNSNSGYPICEPSESTIAIPKVGDFNIKFRGMSADRFSPGYIVELKETYNSSSGRGGTFSKDITNGDRSYRCLGTWYLQKLNQAFPKCNLSPNDTLSYCAVVIGSNCDDWRYITEEARPGEWE